MQTRLDKNKIVIDNKVKVWFENSKLKVEFDRKRITEFEAVDLVSEYLKRFNTFID